MPFDPNLHHRRSIRLKDYDYSQPGAYFITICTEGRNCLFGDVVNTWMKLNDYGQLVQSCWDDLPMHYPYLATDAFMIMPNHVHALMVLLDDIHVGAGLRPAQDTPAKRHSIPEIVRALKSFSARRINELRRTQGMVVWQRDYYDHIVRDEGELRWIREYIVNNPAGWETDIDNIRLR
jgi:putative transposase